MSNNNLFLGVFNRDYEDYDAVVNGIYDNLVNGGGNLGEQVLGYFIRKAESERVILRDSNTVLMDSPQQRRPQFAIKGRIMRDGYISGKAHDINPDIEPAEFDFSNAMLEAKLLRAKVPFSLEVVQDNAERENFIETALDSASNRWGSDMEFLSVFGDSDLKETEPTNYLGILDGWYKQSNNELKPEDLPEGFDVENVFGGMLRLLPAEFRTTMDKLRFYVPYDVYDSYRNCLIERNTALGDTAQINSTDLTYKGVPVVYSATLDAIDSPMYKADGKKGIMLTNPENLTYGIYKELTVEMDKKIPEMRTDYWFNARGDVVCDFKDGIVKCSLTEEQIGQLG